MSKTITNYNIQAALMNIFKRLCFKYGYPVHTLPTLLSKNILFTTLSDELQKEIFKSQNEKYFFRYDLTNGFVFSGLSKRAEIGEVYRYGENSTFRKRAFYQADIDEVYNSNSIKNILQIFVEFFKCCEISVIIKYNDISEVRTLISEYALPIKETLSILDKHKKLNESDLNNELSKALIPFEKYNKLLAQISKIKYPMEYSTLPLEFDYTVIRGLHIYSDFVFEIYDTSNLYSLSGGGKYTVDNKEYFGASIGLTRIMTLYPFENLFKTLVIYFNSDLKTKLMLDRIESCFNFIIAINKNEITQSFKFFLKDILLKNKQIDKLIVIGEKEVNSNTIYVKDLQNNNSVLLDVFENASNIGV